jgi:hypothetical protein
MINTDADNGKGKARSEEERTADHASPKNKGKHLGQEKTTGKPNPIPSASVSEDSILFTGITPVPSATVSKGIYKKNGRQHLSFAHTSGVPI